MTKDKTLQTYDNFIDILQKLNSLLNYVYVWVCVCVLAHACVLVYVNNLMFLDYVCYEASNQRKLTVVSS